MKSVAAAAPSDSTPKTGPAPDLGKAPLKNLAKPGLALGNQPGQLVARNAGHAEALPTSADKNNVATQPLIIATMALSIASAALVRRWFARASS